ncbi:MAG: endonuclease/exonuclease/phosphatase family protein [Thermodesulfobacteriota bacterium]
MCLDQCDIWGKASLSKLIGLNRREIQSLFSRDTWFHLLFVKIVFVESLAKKQKETLEKAKDEERRAQVSELCKVITLSRNDMTIVLGDFNEWLWRARTSRHLNSTFGRSTTLRTFLSRFSIFPLDRVFVRPPGAPIGQEVYSTPLSRMSSDHLPIKALIRINGVDEKLRKRIPPADETICSSPSV